MTVSYGFILSFSETKRRLRRSLVLSILFCFLLVVFYARMYDTKSYTGRFSHRAGVTEQVIGVITMILTAAMLLYSYT